MRLTDVVVVSPDSYAQFDQSDVQFNTVCRDVPIGVGLRWYYDTSKHRSRMASKSVM